MSIELRQRVKDLEAQIEELKKAPKGAFPFEHFSVQFDSIQRDITELKNKYKMLNARVSRKTNAD